MAKTTTVDITRMLSHFKNFEQVIKEEGATILAQAGEVGGNEMRRIIDVSTTDWGEYRMSQGRASAGRRETEAMYSSVGAKVVNGKAKWGWITGTLNYFKYQENGTQTIAGMYALKDSRQKVLDELPRLVKNAKARMRYRARKNS